MSKPVTTWQPIETAPKDGTHILGCGHGAKLWHVMRWAEKFSANHYDGDTSSGWYSPELDKRIFPTYWFKPPEPPQ